MNLKYLYVAALVSLFPIVGIFFAIHKVERGLLPTEQFSTGWKIDIKTDDGLIKGSLVADLPKDLNLTRHNGETLYYSMFKTFHVGPSWEGHGRDLYLALGRIADMDRVYLNDVLVGSTGEFLPGGHWARSDIRVYKVPAERIVDGENTLRIEVQKVGTEFGGVYAGPIGYSFNRDIAFYARVVNFFEKGFIAALGFLLIGVGLYFGFIRLIGSPNLAYLYFSAASFSLGWFDIAVSRLPYEWVSSPEFVFKCNALAAIAAGVAFLYFLNFREKVLSPIVEWTFIVGSGGLALGSIVAQNMDSTRSWYALWMAAFILVFSLWLVSGFLKWRQIKDRFLFGCGAVFFLAVANDIGSVWNLYPTTYLLPYAFSIFIIMNAFQLAQETAYSHSRVESLVKERTEDLAAAIEQLKSMDRIKQRFFGNISHDFKTPIAVALGSIDEFRRHHAQSISQAAVRALQPAEKSMKQLLHMVSDLLDVVKAENGSLKPHWELAKPAQILKDMAPAFEVLSRQKGLVFEVEAQEFEKLSVPMDVSRFSRVIQNLVSNAIKFTTAQSGRANRVRLSMRTSESSVFVDIHDSGMGIPPEEREKVFERFYQSSLTSLKEHGGSGIGLSFVKETIESMNGRVSIKDSDLGGVCFTISLPLSQAREIVLSDAESRIEATELHGSLDVAYPPRKPAQEELGRARVLLAEDNPEVAQISYSALIDDYNVYFAVNGLQALEHLSKFEFDAIVTDIVMPQMKGDELVRRIRSGRQYRYVPIIVLSSNEDDESVIQLLALGANDYVTKPFRREILQARVKAQIETHRLSRWVSQNEKVIEMGLLASGMAHQIRNGLNSLRNQMTLQERAGQKLLEHATDIPTDEKDSMKRRMEMGRTFIDQALSRIEMLTNSIHSYSTGSRARTELTISAMLKTVLALVEDRLSRHQIHVSLHGVEGVKLLGYAALQEAMLNLISNAIDVVPHDGRGQITITCRDVKDRIEISVEDNGPGIPEDVRSRMCQPFFTTKEPGAGTGLGLYIVRDVVEGQHGGHLFIDGGKPSQGQGAKFTLHLPKVAPESATNPEIVLHGVSVA